MIAKISRGWRPGGLLMYLLGPGRFNEHRNPHVLASWDGAADLHQVPVELDPAQRTVVDLSAGHGPVLEDLAGAVRELRAHRLARVEQVRAALGRPGRAVDADDGELVERLVADVYPEVGDPVLLGAAARTVRATLVHLARP